MANDKPTTGGASYIPEASSPEAIKNMANFFGTYFLKGLGVLGQIMTAPLTQQDPISNTHKTREQINQERAIQNEAERQAGTAMSYLSPLNYGVSLATGNGLDPIAGEEEIATWEPYQQALARGAELYTIPKVTRGITNLYTKLKSKTQIPLIEPKPNPDHIKFTKVNYGDYWSPIEYTEASPQVRYPRYKAIKEPKTFDNPMVHEHPGRQFKSLMKGSPLEAQVDKYGDISVKVLKQYFVEPRRPGSGRSNLERQIISKILDTYPYKQRKRVNFDQFKEDVFYALHYIKNDKFDTFVGSYYLDNLGYNTFDKQSAPSSYKSALRRDYPERFQLTDDFETIDRSNGTVLSKENFDTYEPLIDHYTQMYRIESKSDKIPVTYLTKHGSSNSLGTNYVFTVSTEPDILYVRDIDSRFGTESKALPEFKEPKDKASYYVNKMQASKLMKVIESDASQERPVRQLVKQLENLDFVSPLPFYDIQIPYLKRTFFRRQIQQALNRAAEMGRKKVRFPTGQTLHKASHIETRHNPLNETLYQKYKTLRDQAYSIGEAKGFSSPEYNKIINLVSQVSRQYDKVPYWINTPHSQLKINRFDNIPKILKQLLPNQEIRTVTDSKGNTWIEVDVPQNYQYTEQMYKKGGKL